MPDGGPRHAAAKALFAPIRLLYLFAILTAYLATWWSSAMLALAGSWA